MIVCFISLWTFSSSSSFCFFFSPPTTDYFPQFGQWHRIRKERDGDDKTFFNFLTFLSFILFLCVFLTAASSICVRVNGRYGGEFEGMKKFAKSLRVCARAVEIFVRWMRKKFIIFNATSSKLSSLSLDTVSWASLLLPSLLPPPNNRVRVEVDKMKIIGIFPRCKLFHSLPLLSCHRAHLLC